MDGLTRAQARGAALVLFVILVYVALRLWRAS